MCLCALLFHAREWANTQKKGDVAGVPEYEGHRARLKKRFLESGMHTMADYEVLELLLFFVLPRVDTRPLAHRLLREFGSLHGVFFASATELRMVEGVGESTAMMLSMLKQLWQRIYLSVPCEHILDDADRIGQYFCWAFAGMRREQLFAAAIDAKGKLIGYRRMLEGDGSTVSLDLRKLAGYASSTGASYIVLAHNHPSGVATPSLSDINATQAAKAALLPYHVKLLDHVIVADRDYVSLRQSGLIEF